MSEFELLAQDLLEKAEAEEQLRQENDKSCSAGAGNL